MKKIPNVFERDWNGDARFVLNQVHRSCQWVLDGEGVATRKIDGTCCLVRDGKLFKRHEVKAGKKTPVNFEFADGDDETGKVMGWLPVGTGNEDQWHRKAFEDSEQPIADGTYELIGPHIQGNPENVHTEMFVLHGAIQIDDVPRTFDGLREWLAGKDIEGIVFHHPDGRMAKIRLKDFGLNRAKAIEAVAQ